MFFIAKRFSLSIYFLQETFFYLKICCNFFFCIFSQLFISTSFLALIYYYLFRYPTKYFMLKLCAKLIFSKPTPRALSCSISPSATHAWFAFNSYTLCFLLLTTLTAPEIRYTMHSCCCLQFSVIL